MASSFKISNHIVLCHLATPPWINPIAPIQPVSCAPMARQHKSIPSPRSTQCCAAPMALPHKSIPSSRSSRAPIPPPPPPPPPWHAPITQFHCSHPTSVAPLCRAPSNPISPIQSHNCDTLGVPIILNYCSVAPEKVPASTPTALLISSCQLWTIPHKIFRSHFYDPSTTVSCQPFEFQIYWRDDISSTAKFYYTAVAIDRLFDSWPVASELGHLFKFPCWLPVGTI